MVLPGEVQTGSLVLLGQHRLLAKFPEVDVSIMQGPYDSSGACLRSAGAFEPLDGDLMLAICCLHKRLQLGLDPGAGGLTQQTLPSWRLARDMLHQEPRHRGLVTPKTLSDLLGVVVLFDVPLLCAGRPFLQALHLQWARDWPGSAATVTYNGVPLLL